MGNCSENCNLCCYFDRDIVVEVGRAEIINIVEKINEVRPPLYRGLKNIFKTLIKLESLKLYRPYTVGDLCADRFPDSIFNDDIALKVDKKKTRKLLVDGEEREVYPCVALNEERGLCDIYEVRPQTCRDYGLDTPCHFVKRYKFVS